MMRFTMWKLPQVPSLAAVDQILGQHGAQPVPHGDAQWPADELLERRFLQVPGVGPGVHAYRSPGGEREEFLYIQALAERPKRARWVDAEGNLLPHADRVTVAKANVLFFCHQETTFCAIQSKTKSVVDRLREDLFLDRHWGALVEATEYHVEEDFFYWLLERYMRHLGDLGGGLTLLGLSAYHARTLGETHTLTGEGDQVTELLGTLAFIFGNDPFWSMRLRLQFGQELLVFHYDRKGGATIEEGHYEGRFCGESLANERRALIAYFLYTRLVPALLAEYRRFDRTAWSPQVREVFIKAVGIDILRRVARELRLDPGKPLGEYLEGG